MNTIHFSEIVVPEERQRREFNSARITELANAISTIGLLHPIVLRSESEPKLVAGERRLRAVKELAELGIGITFQGMPLEPGHIPYTLMGSLPELAYQEAELSENAIRVDLTWQELTNARAKLHALRSEQAAEKGEKWTATETAKEVFGDEKGQNNVRTISDDVALARHLDDPDVAKAKSKNEAIKIVKRKFKEEQREQLATNYKAAAPKSPHLLVCVDSFDWMRQCDEGVFDIILTDPPYGTDMHITGCRDGTTHEYDDSEEYFGKILSELPTHLYRLTKPQAHAYLFCDINRFGRLAVAMSSAGWDVWTRPFIWYKGNIGAFPKPEHGPRYTYEAVLFANKGEMKTTSLYHDVICIDQIQNQDHPAGKPSEVYLNLLRRSAMPGMKVLDPFCGSGPVFPACDAMMCEAVGLELNPKYHAMSVERLSKKEIVL